MLLEQRPAQQTVMPGMWELPMLVRSDVPQKDLRMTVRHAIMQVNYYVRIRTVFEDDIEGDDGRGRGAPLGAAARSSRDGADGTGAQGAGARAFVTGSVDG